jgi:hypothetical protein
MCAFIHNVEQSQSSVTLDERIPFEFELQLKDDVEGRDFQAGPYNLGISS